MQGILWTRSCSIFLTLMVAGASATAVWADLAPPPRVRAPQQPRVVRSTQRPIKIRYEAKGRPRLELPASAVTAGRIGNFKSSGGHTVMAGLALALAAGGGLLIRRRGAGRLVAAFLVTAGLLTGGAAVVFANAAPPYPVAPNLVKGPTIEVVVQQGTDEVVLVVNRALLDQIRKAQTAADASTRRSGNRSAVGSAPPQSGPTPNR